MRVQSKLIRIFCYCLVISALVVIRVAIARGIQANVEKMDQITIMDEVVLEIDGVKQDVTLPVTLSDLAPRTSVKMLVELPAGDTNSLYLHTLDTSIVVKLGGRRIYQYGRDGTYPEILKDPPATSAIVSLPALLNHKTLVTTFLSPSLSDKMTITPFVLGTEQEILRYLFARRGILLLFSMIQIVIGLVFVVVSLLALPFFKDGAMFCWSGWFAVFSGIWVFGECDLTVLFCFNSVIMYWITFLGMFTFAIPFLCLQLYAVKFRHYRVLKSFVIALFVLEVVAFALQLAGILSLRKSMYVWMGILIVATIVMMQQLLYESLVCDNLAAKRLLFSTLALGLFSFAEIFNYAFGMREYIGYLFQSGIILFVSSTSFIALLFMKDTTELKESQKRIEFEMKLLESQVQVQQEHQLQVLENAKSVRAQCHDLRHQFAVIRQYNMTDNRQALNEYLDSLVADIPVGQVQYCENWAVNAVVTHYVAMAKRANIDITIGVTVPSKNGAVSDNNLCVVFGNLLENAIEACDRVEEGEKKIIMRCEQYQDTLVIVMDNSYDGYCVKVQGAFFSHKRQDYGIGLQSIQFVVDQHAGTCSFEGDDEGLFHSNVMLHIG